MWSVQNLFHQPFTIATYYYYWPEIWYSHGDWRAEGWVDLDGLLYTEMVYLPDWGQCRTTVLIEHDELLLHQSGNQLILTSLSDSFSLVSRATSARSWSTCLMRANFSASSVSFRNCCTIFKKHQAPQRRKTDHYHTRKIANNTTALIGNKKNEFL